MVTRREQVGDSDVGGSELRAVEASETSKDATRIVGIISFAVRIGAKLLSFVIGFVATLAAGLAYNDQGDGLPLAAGTSQVSIHNLSRREWILQVIDRDRMVTTAVKPLSSQKVAAHDPRYMLVLAQDPDKNASLYLPPETATKIVIDGDERIKVMVDQR